MTPSYQRLSRSELQTKADKAGQLLAACSLCPRQCEAHRLEGETGFCQTGRWARVAASHLHFGEEAPLVGTRGSGTIFLAGCNLGCVFCQNADISHSPETGIPVGPEQLAAMMLDLQSQGAHNINLVTPSHVVPQILEGLLLAADQGLDLPLVYNSSGYDLVSTLSLLHGVVDIYMPDTKFFHSQPARKYCQAEEYPQRAREAILEMHRQVGDLQTDEQGIAVRGLVVRHLLMPSDLAGSQDWFSFLANQVSTATYVNIMEQYRPCAQAHRYPELCQPLSRTARQEAEKQARACGLTRFDSGPHLRLRDLFRSLD